jgi:4-hydroxybenzoate polyprenyltransferase
MRQWTKNLLVFLLPLSAGQIIGNNFSFRVFYSSFLIFLALSLVSSFNYAVNDAIDRNKDKLHSVKKRRPIASGALSPLHGVLAGVACLSLGLFISFKVGKYSLLWIGIFVLIQLSYSFVFKKIAGLDILIISILFSIRATSAYSFDRITISPWYIYTVFFTALLLSSGKRISEKMHQEETGTRYVLKDYSETQLQIILAICGAGIIFSYLSWVEYSIQQSVLLWGIVSFVPVIAILIRAYPLILSEKGEKPETALLGDKIILVAGIIWVFLYLKTKGYL